MTTSRTPIGRLCRHHNVSHFDCGEGILNFDLSLYWEACNSGDQTLVFAAANSDDVIGYVAFQDRIVRSQERGEDLAVGREVVDDQDGGH